MISFKEYSDEIDVACESVELTDEELSQLTEVLDTSARIKKRQQFIRRKARLAVQRKAQSRRLADTGRLRERAKRRARNLLIRRLYQGRSKAQIPLSQRKQVDLKLKKLSRAVTRISSKLIRRVRQEDIARKTKRKLPKFNQSGQVGF